MFSIRCKLAVRSELNKLGIPYKSISLGEVVLQNDMTTNQFDSFKSELLKCGLEVMDNKNARTVKAIKEIIIEMVHYAKDFPKEKFSDYISDHMKMNYSSLSSIFVEGTGITIENYIIAHKIDRAKELMLFENYSLSQIAFDLNYSSASHLSNQFKKVTGMTPTCFVTLMHDRKLALQSKETFSA